MTINCVMDLLVQCPRILVFLSCACRSGAYSKLYGTRATMCFSCRHIFQVFLLSHWFCYTLPCNNWLKEVAHTQSPYRTQQHTLNLCWTELNQGDFEQTNKTVCFISDVAQHQKLQAFDFVFKCQYIQVLIYVCVLFDLFVYCRTMNLCFFLRGVFEL